MLRISKLTDYGIVLLACVAREAPGTTLAAREMSESTGLPHPVVSKMLKTLKVDGIIVGNGNPNFTFGDRGEFHLL